MVSRNLEELKGKSQGHSEMVENYLQCNRVLYHRIMKEDCNVVIAGDAENWMPADRLQQIVSDMRVLYPGMG